MADTFGALAQSLPATTTLTDAYTVPGAKRATVEIVICNRGAAATVRLSHAVGGAVDANPQYLLYDFPLGVGETKSTDRITLKASDILRVYSDTGDVAFNINGIEEDV